ncbi:MAG: antitermination protein N [Scandinavium sp.]|uniref:transcriptional antitermination N peptide n=1 Tax=Scandinavium sp. TaxID=2830653 RepID=UPI003F358AB5
MIKQQNIKSNARSRRDARRKEKQVAFAAANPMMVGRHYDVDMTPVEIDQRAGYEPSPIKFIAQDAAWQRQEYKRQIERASVLYTHEFGRKQVEIGGCLSQVAIYAAGHRGSKSITAR